MKIIRTFLAFWALLGTSVSLTALEIYIDFGDSAGTPGGNWNQVLTSSPDDLPLIDFNTGLDSGLTVTLNTLSLNNGFSVNWSGGNLGGWMEDAAGDDLIGTLGTGQVVIDGLGSNVVQIDFVSAWFDNATAGNYTIDGNNADRTQTGDPVSDPWLGNANGAANYLIWDTITPTAGMITIDLTEQATAAGVSAMRITVVPEPSSYAFIMGFAFAGFTLYRRRKA